MSAAEREVVAGEPAAARARRRRLPSRQAALLGAGLVAAAFAAVLAAHWWTVGRFIESTSDAYVGGDVTAIAPHVSGFIAEIAVADNQRVRSGQLLVRIAPADFAAARERAAAGVAGARAAIADLRARMALQRSLIAQARAALAASRYRMRFDAEDAARDRALARSGAGSLRQEQRAATVFLAAGSETRAARAHVGAARRTLTVLAARLRQARAALEQARARLRTASLDLGYTEIRSPIDGYVGDRSAQRGAYVTAGTQLLAIVPARGLWVDANFKEDELARMRPGQPATVVADVAPGRVFHGQVISLSPATGAVFSIIPPQNATGNFTKIVQRVPVRIALEGSAGVLGLLRPGLSTTVAVDTAGRPRKRP